MSKKRKNEFLSLVLLVSAVMLLGLASGKLVGYALEAGVAVNTKAGLETGTANEGEALTLVQAQNKKVTDGLKQKNLFFPPPQKPSPPSSCQAIFGDEAYIEDKWVKVGDTLRAGAEVKKIEATYVEIEHEGKRKKLAPIAAVTADSGEASTSASSSGGGGSFRVSGRRPTGRGGGAPERMRGGGLERRGRMGLGGRGGMSEEERREIMEKMRSMPPEERRAYMQEMRSRRGNR
jgi:hypothetical protein